MSSSVQNKPGVHPRDVYQRLTLLYEYVCSATRATYRPRMGTAERVVQSVNGTLRFSLSLEVSVVSALRGSISSLATAGHAFVVGEISDVAVTVVLRGRPIFIALRLGLVVLERLFTLHLG